MRQLLFLALLPFIAIFWLCLGLAFIAAVFGLSVFYRLSALVTARRLTEAPPSNNTFTSDR